MRGQAGGASVWPALLPYFRMCRVRTSTVPVLSVIRSRSLPAIWMWTLTL